MIATTNPITDPLDPTLLNREGLLPAVRTLGNGQPLMLFADPHLELLKIDINFEAGTSLQQKLLQAGATIHLVTEGTSRHTAREIAEFMDRRGIVMERSCDTVSAGLSVYTPARYAEALFPLLHEILTEPAFPQREFDLYMEKRRMQLRTNLQKTSYVARNLFYSDLYGAQHPIGRYALDGDIEGLTVEDVREFFRGHYRLGSARYTLSGAVSDEVVALFERSFGQESYLAAPFTALPAPAPVKAAGMHRHAMPQAVQNTLRVGRLLPFAWDDPDYAHFMVLSTLLGGYFGSRLMSNIREDKGYTYGINAISHMFRGSIAFYIVTDVAADKAEPALEEIWRELRRLGEEPVGEEELRLVRNTMTGDFLRSIDGIFERSERHNQMTALQISERFTDNYLAALAPEGPGATTPEKLQQLARELLAPEALLAVNVGVNG